LALIAKAQSKPAKATDQSPADGNATTLFVVSSTKWTIQTYMFTLNMLPVIKTKLKHLMNLTNGRQQTIGLIECGLEQVSKISSRFHSLSENVGKREIRGLMNRFVTIKSSIKYGKQQRHID